MSNYYIKSKTRGNAKGTPQQALSYLTDDHDSKRVASASRDEIDYITRINPGYKTDLEGGKVPLVGHGICSRLPEAKMRRVFLKACIPTHKDSLGRKTTATEGYKSHTVTLPKELSLLAETNPKSAYKAMNRAISKTLEKTYPGKSYAAVSAIHRRNNEAEIHYHAHVLVAKFVKDKKTGKVHSLNNTALTGGLGYEMKQMKFAWEQAVTRELSRELNVQIKQERNQKITITLPDGTTLDGVNRASRRRIELAIAPQVSYIDKHGNEKTKAFNLTKMDAKILEIGSREKGKAGWNKKEFLNTFPNDSKHIERYEKRVETLKQIGYLSPSGRVTKEFSDHAKLKWGDTPQLHQIRTELETASNKKNNPKSKAISQNDIQKQERINTRTGSLGLSESDMKKVQNRWLEERPKSTPELKELIQAERELERLDRTSKKRIWGTPLEYRILEIDKVNDERAALVKKIEELKYRADLSMVHPNNRTNHDQAQTIKRSIEADSRHMEGIANQIKALEQRKYTDLANADPKNARRIEKQFDEKIKPLKATHTCLSEQIQASRKTLEHLQSQPKQSRDIQEQKQRIINPTRTATAFRTLLTNKGIGFLVKTALGPGLAASVTASLIQNMLKEKEVAKHIAPDRIHNLKKGIEAISINGDPQSKDLSRWQGREDRLAARMELAKSNPDKYKALDTKTQEAAKTAEKTGNLINRANSFAKENTYEIPRWLEPLKDEITRINSRCHALGIEPLTDKVLGDYSKNQLINLIENDPTMKILAQPTSDWLKLSPNIVQLSITKLKVIEFTLGLGR